MARSLAFLLALVAPSAIAQDAIQRVQYLLDASLTNFEDVRGDLLETADTESRWAAQIAFEAGVFGSQPGTIHEIRPEDPRPATLYYTVTFTRADSVQALRDLLTDLITETDAVFGELPGGHEWSRFEDAVPTADEYSVVTWTECPGHPGGRFVNYAYEPSEEGGARVSLAIGRSPYPSCVDSPHRFSPKPPE